jgi:hypothetical protein
MKSAQVDFINRPGYGVEVVASQEKNQLLQMINQLAIATSSFLANSASHHSALPLALGRTDFHQTVGRGGRIFTLDAFKDICDVEIMAENSA